MADKVVGVNLKILQIYYEPIQSGQTTHVLSLSQGLVARGHEVTAVIPEILKNIEREYSRAGVRVIIWPMKKIFWPVKSIYAFIDLLRQEKFEVVHVHSQEAGMIARFLARLGGAPKVFYTPQTIDIRQRRWEAVYQLLERFLALFTTMIFSVSQADAQRMISWGIPAGKVSIVPNGIDFKLFESLDDRVTICRQLNLNPDHPIIMQVGRLNPQKNPAMFLEGAKRILIERPDAQMVWIGDGPLLNAMKIEVYSSQLQDKIYLLGRINQAYRCMPAADVITSTSDWEGLPYTLLEAMACSKPVVSTAVNGCSELVIDGRTGFLVKSGDALNWAESVLQLVADPQRAQTMGLEGRRSAEKRYSLKSVISRIEQAYEEA